MDEEKKAPPAAGQTGPDEKKRFQFFISDPSHSVNPNAETIPGDLKPYKQWVNWKYKKTGNEYKKPPVVPGTKRQASVNDDRDWDRFEAALKRYKVSWDTIAGVGFVLTDKDPFTVIDLDDCLDEKTGKLKPHAAEVVNHFDSYTEFSPSGTGIHIFIKARLKNRNSLKPPGVEIFYRRHYVTVTGAILGGRDTIYDRQAELDAFIQELSGETTGGGYSEEAKRKSQEYQASSLSDEELLEKARRAKNAEKFNRLWAGDNSGHGGDDSSTDMSLCTLLAYWSKDPDQIDRLFRQSGLMRPKWDKRHSADGQTYGQMTIKKAIAYVTENRSKTRKGDAITAAELIEKEFPEPKWAIENILPEGLAILAGKPKMGKSILALQISLSVAIGEDALGRFRTGKGKVIYFGLEDSERRLKDRMLKLLHNGAKAPDNLIFLTKIKAMDHGGLDFLDECISENRGAVLIIIDTLACFRSGSKSKKGRAYDIDHKEIVSIKTLADKHQTTILLVHHQRKMEADDPMDTVSGTFGITGAADTLLVLTRKGTNREDAILHIRGRDVEEDEIALKFDRPHISWHSLGPPSTLKNTSQQQRLFDALRNLSSHENPLSPKYLEKITGLSGKYIRTTLRKLMDDGSIKKADRAKYYYVGDIKGDAFNDDIQDIDDEKDIKDNEDKAT